MGRFATAAWTEDLVGMRVTSVTCGRCWSTAGSVILGAGRASAAADWDVRVDAQAGLAMMAPIWGYPPLLDIA